MSGEHTHPEYLTEAQAAALFADVGHTHEGEPVHDHNDRYYSRAEVDVLLATRASLLHDHDDRYYTRATIDMLLTAYAPLIHAHPEYAASTHLHDQIYALATHAHGGGGGWVPPDKVRDLRDYPVSGLQGAINDLPGGGNILCFVPEVKPQSPVTIPPQQYRFKGLGSSRSELAGHRGRTTFLVEHEFVGATYNPGPINVGATFTGPVFEDMDIRGTPDALGGFELRNTNNHLFRNVTFGGFSKPGAFEFHLNAKKDPSSPHADHWVQYGVFLDCTFGRSAIGVKSWNPSGLRFLGCHFDGALNGGISNTVPGSIGYLQEGVQWSASTTMMLGCVMQGYELLLDVRQGDGDQFIGGRYEVWGNGSSTTAPAIRIGAQTYGVAIVGGSFANNLGGTRGTCCEIVAGAQLATFQPNRVGGVTSSLRDFGSGTYKPGLERWGI